MERLTPFLVGGPPYSGTTLLALLINQPGTVCLDEPDFEKPTQHHRGIPVRRRMFPAAPLPDQPEGALTFEEAFELVRACSDALRPTALGFKTCGRDFISFARLFRGAGLPVITLVRDIPDALVRPLPSWSSEATVEEAFRSVWQARGLATLVIRYEDLVTAPEPTMARVAASLGLVTTPPTSWDPAAVPGTMLKLDRHDLLKAGRISSSRVGIWRGAGRAFPPSVTATARLMGYGP